MENFPNARAHTRRSEQYLFPLGPFCYFFFPLWCQETFEFEGFFSYSAFKRCPHFPFVTSMENSKKLTATHGPEAAWTHARRWLRPAQGAASCQADVSVRIDRVISGFGKRSRNFVPCDLLGSAFSSCGRKVLMGPSHFLAAGVTPTLPPHVPTHADSQTPAAGLDPQAPGGQAPLPSLTPAPRGKETPGLQTL